MSAVKKELSHKSEMKVLGPLHYFLGVKSHWKARKWSDQCTQRSYKDMVGKTPNLSAYLSILMSSLLLARSRMTCVTSSSIAVCCICLQKQDQTSPTQWAVLLSSYCAKPSKEHWTGVKRSLRYLTNKFGLIYREDTPVAITGYSDADWDGDVRDRKSTSGYVFLLGVSC